MTPHCRACGTANEIDARFCDQCGEALRVLAHDADKEAEAPVQSAVIPRGKTGVSPHAFRPALGYGLGAVFLSAVAIADWTAFSGVTPTSDSPERIRRGSAASGAQPPAGSDFVTGFSDVPSPRLGATSRSTATAAATAAATATAVAFYSAVVQGNTDEALALIHPAQRGPGTHGKIAVYLSTQKPKRAGPAAGPLTFKTVVERENDTSATVRITVEGSGLRLPSEWLELLKHEGRWFVSLL